MSHYRVLSVEPRPYGVRVRVSVSPEPAPDHAPGDPLALARRVATQAARQPGPCTCTGGLLAGPQGPGDLGAETVYRFGHRGPCPSYGGPTPGGTPAPDPVAAAVAAAAT